jgi:hypothetical protein
VKDENSWMEEREHTAKPVSERGCSIHYKAGIKL